MPYLHMTENYGNCKHTAFFLKFIPSHGTIKMVTISKLFEKTFFSIFENHKKNLNII